MFVIGEETMTGVMVSIWFVISSPVFSCSVQSLTEFPSCYFPVVLFRSREHENCGPQPGYVRAHIESQFFIFIFIFSDAFFLFVISYSKISPSQLVFFPSLGGGFNISPLKPRNGRPRAQVQHLIHIDLKGWGVGYLSSFQQHCVLQMLNSVAGEVVCLISY